MKKYFVVLASALFLASCQESEVCQCISESTKMMKENRESGYKNMTQKPGPACEKVKDKFEGNKTEADKKKMEAELKACPGYKEYEKELKLMMEHIMKPIQEMQESLGEGAGEELNKAMEELEKELDKQ